MVAQAQARQAALDALAQTTRLVSKTQEYEREKTFVRRLKGTQESSGPTQKTLGSASGQTRALRLASAAGAWAMAFLLRVVFCFIQHPILS